MLTREETHPGPAEWLRVRTKLKSRMGQYFELWFTSAEFEKLEGDTVHLSVATAFQRDGIARSAYLKDLLELWRGENPSITRVAVAQRTGLHRRAELGSRPVVPQAAPNASWSVNGFKAPVSAPLKQPMLESSPREPRFTLEHFMVGKCNELAHAAAMQVVNGPEIPTYNPLCFYGKKGLGKTHLLQGIAQACTVGGRPVRYVTSQQLMGELIGVRRRSAIEFKAWVGDTNPLIVDDLHLLEDDLRTMKEFGMLLTALLDVGRQVVCALNRPVADLDQFDPRIRARLAGGLNIELIPWDMESCAAFIRRQLGYLREKYPDWKVADDVVQCLANMGSWNGRRLLLAMSRLEVNQLAHPGLVTYERVQPLLQDLFYSPEKRVRVEDVIQVVCKHYGVSRADLLSSRRTANVVRPRQIAMYLAKFLTRRSLPEVGQRFGGRDHTTVLHAVRKIEGLARGDGALLEELGLLRKKIEELCSL